jgi:drug/metabolite transporter (DMT)-like permease
MQTKTLKSDLLLLVAAFFWGMTFVAQRMGMNLAFTLQIVCQRTSPPAHAAIVISLETIFAALAGYLILNERLTARNLIGCVLMLADLFVVQLLLQLGSPAD